MKAKNRFISTLASLLIAGTILIPKGFAQDTSFTFQGMLNTTGGPASGNFDFTFQLYTVPTGGVGLEPVVTNLDVGVTNGLFLVPLQFSPTNFTGAAYWVAISVRTNGSGPFAALSPRQPITPVPYALFAPTATVAASAGSVLAGGIIGKVTASQVATNIVTNGASGVNFSGTFSGDGSGLTNLPLSFINVVAAGVTNDGVTDVTVPLQKLLNKGGSFYFPAGRYLAQELRLTNNTTLLGNGCNGSVLVYANNASNTNIFVRCGLNTNISVSGLGFEGGDYSYIGSRTYVTGEGVQDFADPSYFNIWNPMGLRHALQFNTEGGGKISDLFIHGFSGIGLLPVSVTGVGGAQTLKTVVTGINAYGNFCGVFASGSLGQSLIVGTNVYLPNWITNYVPGGQDPEFMIYSGLNLFSNTVGLAASAGDNTIVNSILDGNFFGEIHSGGFNANHGAINSVLYTHNIGAALFMGSCTPGEEIINCQFRDNQYGTITLNNIEGVTIDYCTFSPLCISNILTCSGGLNFFRHNTYGGKWSSGTFVTDGHLVYFGNNSYDTAGDNDGQPFTLLESGNTSGLTFTNAAGTPFSIQVNPATNGFIFSAP